MSSLDREINNYIKAKNMYKRGETIAAVVAIVGLIVTFYVSIWSMCLKPLWNMCVMLFTNTVDPLRMCQMLVLFLLSGTTGRIICWVTNLISENILFHYLLKSFKIQD